jgi:hypothetical protein
VSLEGAENWLRIFSHDVYWCTGIDLRQPSGSVVMVEGLRSYLPLLLGLV